MRFKSIELTGFKSFVDHTKITLGKGFTAIVGPNGCGKSNISDAIRWVIGEQRAKTLRGAKMEDFIFSGSASRKPSGMAEVSLTLSGVAGKLSRPELAEFDEITITRRLYRSGESEYMVNKTPCRLKDVVDLFLDTGISTRAFSIIEQDQVQKIVTSKPEERRFIVEEAAGIMKYKSRRHTAMNKLEGSRTNLERVEDIVRELERQRNSLKRQAGKAEKFKNYRAQIVQLILATSAGELKNLTELKGGISQEQTRLEEVRTSLETEISTLKNRSGVLQSMADEQTGELGGLKEEEYRLTALVERNEENIKLFGRQIEEAAQRTEKLLEETAELGRNRDRMRVEQEDNEKTLERLKIQADDKAQKLAEKRGEFASGQLEIDAMTSQTATAANELAQTQNQLSELGGKLASNKTRAELLVKRMEQNEREEGATQADLENANSRKKEKEGGLLSSQESYKNLLSEVGELEEKYRARAEERTVKEKSVLNLKTETAQQRARLESLVEIDRSHEGYQKGIQALLRLKDQNHEVGAILQGTLLDRIKVDRKYEKALEALASEKLQAILIKNPEDALTAIDLLRQDNLGRGTFLPLDTAETASPKPINDDGVIGHAADMIETDDELRPLIRKLLGDVVFVKGLSDALRLRANSGFTFVTEQGDVVDRFGLISGGSVGNSGAGILERKRNIEELTGSIAKHEQTLGQTQTELERISDGVKELGSIIEERKRVMKEEEFRLLTERKDIESLDEEIRRHESGMETSKAAKDSLEIEMDGIKATVAQEEESAKNLETHKTELEGRLEFIREKQSGARANLSMLGEALSAMEVSAASLQGEIKMAVAEKQRLANALQELESRLTAVGEDISSGASRKKEMEEETVLFKEEAHISLEKRESISKRIREVSDSLGESRAEVERMEEEAEKSSNALEQTRESLNEAKLKLSESSMKIAALLEKAEEHDITEERIKAFNTDGPDMEEASARLVELKEKLAGMGDVNLTAIEDYNQVAERLNFLTTQRDDLLESIGDIKKVIDKLNRTTRGLFEETFKMIRLNFQQNFKKLFNGGEADMTLTDETDMLETGIEIFVRPPGKRRQNITLLSAGEKAMTAVAILFSVFMVKPSPFCLLDEVDAPLDETNVRRFKEILKEFADRTQFLVITHNQKTMAFADVLYGITMQEPGISRVLSVDLLETDHDFTKPLRAVNG